MNTIHNKYSTLTIATSSQPGLQGQQQLRRILRLITKQPAQPPTSKSASQQKPTSAPPFTDIQHSQPLYPKQTKHLLPPVGACLQANPAHLHRNQPNSQSSPHQCTAHSTRYRTTTPLNQTPAPHNQPQIPGQPPHIPQHGLTQPKPDKPHHNQHTTQRQRPGLIIATLAPMSPEQPQRHPIQGHQRQQPRHTPPGKGIHQITMQLVITANA